MNWLLAEELAREHTEALRRAAGHDRFVRQARGARRAAWRRLIGTPIVRAGLAIAAGLRAAKSAPDVIGAAACDQAPFVGASR